MLNVSITPESVVSSKREALEDARLRVVKVEYFNPRVSAVTPVGMCRLLVPVGANVQALERMLALWSMGTNEAEELEQDKP